MTGQSNKTRDHDAKQSLLQSAVKLHQSGQLQEAERLYLKILQAEPRNLAALYLLALVAKQAGDHETAKRFLEQTVEIDPAHVDAWINLGHTHNEIGNLDEALSAYQRALEINPRNTQAHNNLGSTLRELGRLDDAVAAYQCALEINPDYLPGLINLGDTLQDQHKLNDAGAVYERALEIDPRNVDAQYNLAKLLKKHGKLDEALVAYQQVLAVKPDFADVYNNIGNILKNQHKLDEAVTAYQKALALQPDFPEAYYNLGNALKDQGQLTDAVAAYKQAIALKPGFAEAQYSLGNVLTQQNKPAEAIAAYRRSIEIDPHHVDAHLNLGIAMQKVGQPGQAIVAYRRVLELEPDSAKGHSNLGTALAHQGKLSEAIAAFRQALVLKPDYAAAHSNLLLNLHYQSQKDPAELYMEHQRWARQHALPLADTIQPHGNDPEHQRLRVGYVSPDFRLHSVAYFFEPLLRAHDRTTFEIICYSDVSPGDAVTERLRGLADTWRDISHMADDEVAGLVREDGVDILVDLAGHTAHNRMLVFARKPAPVQVTYLGYPNTTGLATMDYRLTDGWADPPGQVEKFQVEELVRLQSGFLCYQPPRESPAVAELPSATTGHVTFGCFNNSTKVSPAVVAVWSKILLALPDARLIMKSYQLDDASTRQHFIALFKQGGVSPDRVELLGATQSIAGHLQTYNRVDIGLDPFPYNGTTTTCDALWMGVPVIVLSGDTHASRVGASLLSNAGYPQLIAQTVESYVELAVRLANDRERLRELRSELRANIENSPITDAKRFTRSVETAYRTMWQRWGDKK